MTQAFKNKVWIYPQDGNGEGSYEDGSIAYYEPTKSYYILKGNHEKLPEKPPGEHWTLTHKIIKKDEAKDTYKSLHSELASLSPSTLLTFFELDVSTVEKTKLAKKDDSHNISREGEQSILRFHNNKEFPKKDIIWQGKTFSPVPIQAEGFDMSSRGVLPTPKISMSTDSSEENIEKLSIIRRLSREYGDIIGSKVTRIRTFLKYLDRVNFEPLNQAIESGEIVLPQDYEPDPYAELPRDIFYIERKTSESPTEISYELSSLIDVEGIKLPRRVITSTKCSFKYRGCGCFYESKKDGKDLLKRCESENVKLLKSAPPVSNNQDELIESLIGVKPKSNPEKYTNLKKPEGEKVKAGTSVYITRNSINYYYVLKEDTANPPPPPNEEYWIADACSKNLVGCRQRWGFQSKADFGTNGETDFAKGELQFGGFPNATRINQF